MVIKYTIIIKNNTVFLRSFMNTEKYLWNYF